MDPYEGPGRPPRPPLKREHPMIDWTTVAQTIGDLLEFAAATITLIAVLAQEDER
ncbi:hypothetical protein Axi01nite_43910 [Actinoplanes xinjiangensis]|nr:hypothetical protein Axi01nite_43910 [Actinoplanes xinjiangensis]